ncbi:hypothetical protein HF313_22895 [Massilia atriviolacea]|uniref:Uncharacterized protein n=1 Tax=Massilia atriviolacea TaxID=2495579 RepID=A0A430HCJ0_9BURK|nr:hypothetical protein [Massilia atriviolacea]RSZ55245.1 hypothetical protein EJB06_30440 [Massilia atriviolacea]
MTNENSPNDEPEAAPDVFDMALPRETTPPPHDTLAGMRSTSTNDGDALASIGPRHFAGLAVAIAVVWLAWPAENSKTPSTENSPVLNTQLRSTTSRSTPLPNDRTGQNTAPRGPSGKQVALPRDGPGATGSQQLEMAGEIIQAQAQQAAALVAAIDNLGARLAVVEARLSAPDKPSLELPGHSAKNKNSPREKQVRSNERARTSADRVAAPVVPGYSLNTIYTGQAWIVRDGHLNVVQRGDVIEDFKVIRIDAREHQVLTSRGIIR